MFCLFGFQIGGGISYLSSSRVTGLLLRQFIENEGGCRQLVLPVSQNAFIYRNRISVEVWRHPLRGLPISKRVRLEHIILPALRCSEMQVRDITPAPKREA